MLWEWQVGEGYSGPVASGSRVWAQTRKGEKEVVSRVALNQGELLWSGPLGAPG